LIWLKRPKPGKGPPPPGHVDLVALMAQAGDMAARGINSAELTYLKAHAPRLAVDKWGQPLPLSTADQFRLDRTFALLASPLARGKALLESGRLTPDEVQALEQTNPQVLDALVQTTVGDMTAHPAPYAQWVEAVLGFLFQKPPDKYFRDLQSPGGNGPHGNVTPPGAPPTPVDRLEKAVRDQPRR
jgi:hypothetical protein